MFKALGFLLAIYVAWAAVDGKVFAKQSGLRGPRYFHRDEEPGWFWTIIAVYGLLSLAMVTIF